MRKNLTAICAMAVLFAPAAVAAQQSKQQGSQQSTAAQPSPQMTEQDRQLLASLPQDMRDHVMSRMGPGHSVRGVLETTLLNRLGNPPGIKGLRNVEIIYRGEAQQQSGEWTLVDIDPVRYVVLPPRTMASGMTSGTAAAGTAMGSAGPANLGQRDQMGGSGSQGLTGPRTTGAGGSGGTPASVGGAGGGGASK